MLQMQLILVEGLPGSGKSTLAQYLAIQLRRNGLSGRWFYEEEVPHPLRAPSGSMPSKLPTLDAFIVAQLSFWTAFVAQAKPSAAVTILDSSFFQNPLAILLRQDVLPKDILNSVRSFAKVAHPLEPVLLYFDQSNVEDALHAICTRRGRAWEKFHVRRMNDTPFARHRGVTGFEGLLRFWREHKALADQLAAEFSGNKLLLDRSRGDWPSHYRNIAAFLSLPFLADDTLPEALLNTYAGTYTYREEWGEQRIREFTLQLEGQSLTLHGFPWLWPGNRLLPKAPHVFYAEAWPFEFIFEEDSGGVIQSMKAGNQAVNWGGITQVFPKAHGQAGSAEP